LQDGSFALAVVRRVPESKPVLEHCAIHSVEGEIAPVLKSTLDKAGAARASTCAVIDGDDYQIVQVEAPEVLPSEMRAAIRWRLRDAISFSVDEASVDVFEIPDAARRAQQKMLFAVAARDTAVQRIALSLRGAAKGFNAIDIPELCLRNIAAVLPQDQKGVAILAVNEKFAQLVLTRQGTLYLTRRIDTTRRFEPHATDRQSIDAGSLALEIQRSLDYYESHFDQAAIGDLVLAPADDRVRKLADDLKNETSLRVSVLDAREHLIVQKSGEVVADWATLMALGAALRTDSAEG
jgi:MSHA biogenesis protein MshI